MTTYDYRKDGADIYRESFRIIRAESNLERFPADVEPVVCRMIHAAAQPDLADVIEFTDDVVARGRAALAAGAPILCDSTMVATGIIRSRLPRGNEVVCHLQDPTLAAEAEALGTTKTAAAVERWRDQLDGAVIAIGNAPTSLFRLLEVLHTTDARPAAIVGIPVGFVGAKESKQALVDNDLGLSYITVLDRRGGSAITCACVNAMASTAETDNRASEAAAGASR